MMERCLRHGDRLLLSIRLESTHLQRSRFFCIISSSSKSSQSSYSILGIDSVLEEEDEGSSSGRGSSKKGQRLSIGLAFPFDANARVCLDGDGGFSIFRPSGQHFIFKPVSVQGLWTVIQTLHMISSSSRRSSEETQSDYIINSPQSCINEWHAMSDLLVKRPPSPDSILDSEGEELESLIKSQLRQIMKTVDLDNITSKCIRNALEEELKMDLCDYKPFIDKEILVILGQMDPASKILDYVYLGSEWNASNLDELKANGITHILNVTREIDNFFPATFEYRNIRVYDEEATDLLKFFDDTYRFIHKAYARNGKVLIHCKMGISRSATVTMSYLMKEYEKSLEDVIIFVKERRDIINPNKSFIKQLEVYEGILGAIRHRHNRLFRSKSESSLKHKEDLLVPKKRAESTNGSNYKHSNSNGGENQKNARNNRLHRTRSTKKVKALANAFNRTDLLARPKSWSPNERISSLLLNSNQDDDETDESLLHIDEECTCYNDIVTKIVVSSSSSSSPSTSATVSSISDNIHCACHVELELEVPGTTTTNTSSSPEVIVQNLSDLPIRLRQRMEEDVKKVVVVDCGLEGGNKEESRKGNHKEDTTELLSVKTIANMFDIKEVVVPSSLNDETRGRKSSSPT